jgi:Fe-S-cluster-containing dehydrogenase component
MKKWNMIIDVSRCHDCNDCFLSDKDEFVGNDWPPYSVAQPRHGQRWMNINRQESGQYPKVRVCYMPTPCLHCVNAPCLTADGAVYTRPDGLVIIDPEKAVGRKEIVESCPYGVIYWNEEKNVAQKCTGCAHLMDEGWKDTRCTQKVDEGLQVYRPDIVSDARVYYKNFDQWTKSFIAGGLVFADTDECAEGAKVTLRSGGKTIAEATTDNFGDFLLEGLEVGTDYEIDMQAAGYKLVTRAVSLEKSLNIGSIFLER